MIEIAYTTDRKARIVHRGEDRPRPYQVQYTDGERWRVWTTGLTYLSEAVEHLETDKFAELRQILPKIS